MVMRIAIIEPVGGHGGMDYYDFGLSQGLANTGANVVLHTCDETHIPVNANYQVRHTYKKIYGKSPSWQRGIRYIYGSIKALYSAVCEGRRLVHFHLFHVGLIETLNIFLAHICFREIVITAHDVESFVDKLEVPVLSRWVYKRAQLVIAHNQISKSELIDRIGLRSEKVCVIPHGNYLHSISAVPQQDDARAKLGVPKRSKLILFFGQIKDVKGLDLLLEAMPGVLEKHSEAMLMIAGKPWKSNFNKYDKIIKKLNIARSCITHIRYIPDEDVPLYYSACNLVVLPYHKIYQSGVVLMAMSYSKPVIVSDLPGMTEIVTDGKNGFVFLEGDKNDLIEHINQCLSDNILLDRIAARGLEYVKSQHDWSEIGKKTVTQYQKILGKS